MIIVTGSVRTTPETAARLTEICMAHSARSRAEPGCIAHNVHTDCEDPSRLVFIEYWQDMDALKAHFSLKESRDFVKEARKLSANGEAMRIFEAAEVKAAA